MDIRLTPAQKDSLAQAASRLGLSLSEEYVLLSCSPDPETLDNILRKARPVDRADPQLITALTRGNLLLAELRDLMRNTDADAPVTHKAILATLLSLHRQLEGLRR